MPGRSTLYTVSFVTPSGEEVVSRFFSAVRNARKYAAWLVSRPAMASSAKIYRGPAGGELVETVSGLAPLLPV